MCQNRHIRFLIGQPMGFRKSLILKDLGVWPNSFVSNALRNLIDMGFCKYLILKDLQFGSQIADNRMVIERQTPYLLDVEGSQPTGTPRLNA